MAARCMTARQHCIQGTKQASKHPPPAPAPFPRTRATPGDEYGQTRGGNNNWYGHDSPMTHFDWHALDTDKTGFFRFYRCARLRVITRLLRV